MFGFASVFLNRCCWNPVGIATAGFAVFNTSVQYTVFLWLGRQLPLLARFLRRDLTTPILALLL
jgi:hypothetical protein